MVCEQKINRLNKQRDTWATVQKLPMRAQADTLFGLWPRKLPKQIRKELSYETLSAWREKREAVENDRWLAIMEMLRAEESIEIKAHLLAAYQEEIESLMDLLDSLPNVIKVTCVYKDHVATFNDLTDEEFRDDLQVLIALAMHGEGGGLQVRQQLQLRTQVADAHGAMAWHQQERVYGVQLGQGTWEPLSEKDMRWAYNTDSQTGKTLPRDPITTFGDMRDVAKKAKIKPIHWN